jgi:ATP phosphoribosyltransferase
MTEAVLAIPSKGRLKDDCLAMLARAGLTVAPPNERSYETFIPALPGVRIILISASEIAERLPRGDFHAGITGEDVLRERLGVLDGADRADSPLTIGADGPVRISRLGFGPADVVVAAPMSWLDCETMADLREIADEIRTRQHRPLRVATKYVRLTRAFFAHHVITDYRIALSTGATEAAPASGLADVIVDITTSGATLRDNKLAVLKDGLMFKSQACLFQAPAGAAVWKTGSDLIGRVAQAIGEAARKASDSRTQQVS